MRKKPFMETYTLSDGTPLGKATASDLRQSIEHHEKEAARYEAMAKAAEAELKRRSQKK